MDMVYWSGLPVIFSDLPRQFGLLCEKLGVHSARGGAVGGAVDGAVG